MPTRDPRKTLYKVGDIVCLKPTFNGAGDEVIWRITKIEGELVFLTRLIAITNPSVFNFRKTPLNTIRHTTVLELCELRQKVDNVVQELVRKNST